jgi:beta-hydroxylase
MKYTATDLYHLQAEMKEQSLVGNHPVHDKADFPWTSFLEENCSEIAAEFENFVKAIPKNALPNLQDISKEQELITNDDNWKILPLLFYNEVNRITVSKMPITFSVINAIPTITTCFFSVLSPGKHIPLHKGPYAGVLRCHLAIKVPKDSQNCWISVDGIKLNWKQGEAIIFDDTYEHEVYNNTEESRVVLFIDFLRPLPADISMVNKNVMEEIQNSEFVKQPSSKYEQWENKHLATVENCS